MYLILQLSFCCSGWTALSDRKEYGLLTIYAYTEKPIPNTLNKEWISLTPIGLSSGFEVKTMFILPHDNGIKLPCIICVIEIIWSNWRRKQTKWRLKLIIQNWFNISTIKIWFLQLFNANIVLYFLSIPYPIMLYFHGIVIYLTIMNQTCLSVLHRYQMFFSKNFNSILNVVGSRCNLSMIKFTSYYYLLICIGFLKSIRCYIKILHNELL